MVDRVRSPVFLTKVSAPRVMAPLTSAALALELRRAPPNDTPVPDRVSSLAMVLPLRSKAAPLPDTVTPSLPNAAVAPATKVPTPTVVPPLKSLLPESVSWPAPTLARLPAPVTKPEKVVEVLLAPAESVTTLSNSRPPAPVMEPTVSEDAAW